MEDIRPKNFKGRQLSLLGESLPLHVFLWSLSILYCHGSLRHKLGVGEVNQENMASNEGCSRFFEKNTFQEKKAAFSCYQVFINCTVIPLSHSIFSTRNDLASL